MDVVGTGGPSMEPPACVKAQPISSSEAASAKGKACGSPRLKCEMNFLQNEAFSSALSAQSALSELLNCVRSWCEEL